MKNKKARIFLAGHNGLVGGAILKKLAINGYKNIITVSKKRLDLRDQKKVFEFIKKKNQILLLMLQLVLEE